MKQEKVDLKKSNFKSGFQSKFKHIFSEVMHKSNTIENIKNLAETLPSESDAFQGNRDFLFFPISGVAGRIGVVQVVEIFFPLFFYLFIKLKKESDFSFLYF